MLVHDDSHRDVRDGQPLNEGTSAQDRCRRPARPHAPDANEIGRNRADLRRGLYDQPFDFRPREQFDPRGAVVDLDTGRCARERLEPALQPRPIEGMEKDEHSDRNERCGAAQNDLQVNCCVRRNP